jgi:hypothetical protein
MRGVGPWDLVVETIPKLRSVRSMPRPSGTAVPQSDRSDEFGEIQSLDREFVA